MTVQTKTYTVTLDGSDNPEPLSLIGAAVGFTTTRWVVVSNLTPYIMELEGVGDSTVNQAAVPPGTANKYPWTQKNGPLVAAWVNPIVGAPPSTPQVIVEYSDDETGNELSGTYPTTVQSGVTIGTLTGSVTLSGPVTIDSVTGVVTIDPAPPGVIYGPTLTNVPTGGGPVTIGPIAITPSTRTLVLSGSSPLAASNLIVGVRGVQSGLLYRSTAPASAPYLVSQGGTAWQCVVPVSGVADTSVNVIVENNAGSNMALTLTVAADTSQYDESIFYNGVIQTASAIAVNTNSIILTGPARLLTAFVEAGTGTTGSAEITLGGQILVRADIINTALTAISVPLTFPENTILRSGAQLILQAAALTAVAGVTYAYP